MGKLKKVDQNTKIKGVPIKDLVLDQLRTKNWINAIRLAFDLPAISFTDMQKSNDRIYYDSSGDAIERHLGVFIAYDYDCASGRDVYADDIEYIEGHPIDIATLTKITELLASMPIPAYVIRFIERCYTGTYPWLECEDVKQKDESLADFMKEFLQPHTIVRDYFSTIPTGNRIQYPYLHQLEGTIEFTLPDHRMVPGWRALAIGVDPVYEARLDGQPENE